MPMPPVRHVHIDSLEWRPTGVGGPQAKDSGVRVKALNVDPATGGELWYTHEPPGRGKPEKVHYLPVDEEAYFLDGQMQGHANTTLRAGDYLFYPAGFVHSAVRSDIGVSILIRTSGPMSYVDPPMPEDHEWTRDDERQMLPGRANSRRPISRLPTGDLPWEELQIDGQTTGERIKILSEDRTSRAVTYLYRVPAGWRSPNVRWTSRFTREWYVLEGDLTTGGSDSVTLRAGSYRCVAPGAMLGAEQSEAGCFALCWCDGPLDHLPSGGGERRVTLG